MNIPANLLYTREHEWIRLDGTKGIVGITDFAQEQLGDVVFLELPTEGTQLVESKQFGVVESVKTVSDLYAPVDGNVTAVNKHLEVTPESVNAEPYGMGWMIEFEITSPDQLKNLLTPKQYTALVQEES